jgi:hypothetical protein
VLSGSGAPDSSVGKDGDFYIDTSANMLYGPKAGGNWPGSGHEPGRLYPVRQDRGRPSFSTTATSGESFDQRDIPISKPR